MEVYLVPVGRGRHALYCEPGEEPHPASEPVAGRGMWKRLLDRFHAVLETVEREQEARHAGARPAKPDGLWNRLKTRILAWMAEKVAEQRLLWRLRHQSQVCAWFPTDLDRGRAHAIVRGTLGAEFDRHRWWMVVDGIGGVLSLLLMPIPGPNMLGYYFAFRIVGHFLSVRGARHGLTEVRWELAPHSALDQLNGIEELPAEERERRAKALADELCLRRFPRFYRRMALAGGR